MTLIEFIKSKVFEDTQFGDLAKDIQGDTDFPAYETEENIISYLEFKTCLGGTYPILKQFLKAFIFQKKNETDLIDLDTNITLLQTEKWKFYKEYFPVHKVILIGQHTDFYKAYCIDSTSKKALYFDIKSANSLNDITIVDEENIYLGDFTVQVSVDKAIDLLDNCIYSPSIKPDDERMNELMEFLKANK